MDDRAGGQLTHSTVLFLDESGGPMHFYMRPCPEKSALIPLIKHGGGIISSKLNSDSIKLAPNGMHIKSDEYISQKYITDCAKENKLLDMTKYRVLPGSVAMFPPNSETDLDPSDIIIQKELNKKGRKKYLRCHDLAIIKYLLTQNRYTQVQGNMLWKDMAMLELTQHTWQSMKDRYRKQILPNINSYNLEKHEIARLTGILMHPSRSPSQRSRHSGLTENQSIPQYAQVTSSKTWPSPISTCNKVTVVAEDGMPIDNDLDDFDQDLLANALRISQGCREGGGDKFSEKCVSGVDDSNVPRNRKSHAVQNGKFNNTFDINGGGDRKVRRKRPLEFCTIDNDNIPNSETNTNETNITSTTGQTKSCDADVVVQNPLDGQGTRLSDQRPTVKKQTRKLKPRNDRLEKVDDVSSPRPIPLKKKRKETQTFRQENNLEETTERNKTRRAAQRDTKKKAAGRVNPSSSPSQQKKQEQCTVDNEHSKVTSNENILDTSHDVLTEKSKAIETETTGTRRRTRAATRLVEGSSSEDGENSDDDNECHDPRSYLATRRGPNKALPPDVMTFIMQSSDDSDRVTSPESSNSKETLDEEAEGSTDANANTTGKVDIPKKTEKQKMEDESTVINIFDTVVEWLGIPADDFMNILLHCGGSIDDAVAFILHGREPQSAGGSTGETV